MFCRLGALNYNVDLQFDINYNRTMYSTYPLRNNPLFNLLQARKFLSHIKGVVT